MTSEGLGEMFEGDSADMCTGKFPLVSMGGRADGVQCADPGAKTPIGASGNFLHVTLARSEDLPTAHKASDKYRSMFEVMEEKFALTKFEHNC